MDNSSNNSQNKAMKQPWDVFFELRYLHKALGKSPDEANRLAWLQANEEHASWAELACIKGLRNVIEDDTNYGGTE